MKNLLRFLDKYEKNMRKDKYEKMKENVKNVSEKQENMRLNSVNSRT